MILAIADDLTGALEAGAQFARFGIPACVTTEREFAAAPEADVLVIDTETRHLPESEAAAVVSTVLSSALRFDPWLIFKKTDSTLRGPLAAEFRTLLRALPGRPLVYVPAYPEMGRTVRNGCLFVHGTEVHKTAFANDPLNPVTVSRIAHLLGDIGAAVHDGESPEDIAASAREILAGYPTPIAAGPGALAGALAELIAADKHCPAPPSLPRLSRCLIVNGSLHPASARQLAVAQEQNCLEPEWTPADLNIQGAGLERATQTGEQIRTLLRTNAFDGLIVFGGDTAFGIHRALGSPRFESCGEVIRGVPISRCGGLHWITKAGGFGSPDLLCELRKRLT